MEQPGLLLGLLLLGLLLLSFLLLLLLLARGVPSLLSLRRKESGSKMSSTESDAKSKIQVR